MDNPYNTSYNKELRLYRVGTIEHIDLNYIHFEIYNRILENRYQVVVSIWKTKNPTDHRILLYKDSIQLQKHNHDRTSVTIRIR